MSVEEGYRHRLGTVSRLPLASRVDVLDELLWCCGPEEAGPAALCLLDLAIVPADERPRAGMPRLIRLLAHSRRQSRSGLHMAALRALIRHWSRLPRDIRHVVVVAGRGRLAPAASGLCRSPRVNDRLSVCDLASEAVEFSLAPALSELFSDRDAGVAAAAERALVRLSLIGAGIDPGTGESPEFDEASPISEAELRVLRECVARVLEHAAREKRRAAMVALMAMVEPADLARERVGHGHALARVLRSGEGEVRAAVRNALRWSDGALSRRRALEWLKDARLGGAALERLARARGAAEHECVLTRSHYLAHPARAGRAAMIGRGARPAEGALPPYVPSQEDLGALSVGARRGVARWLRACEASQAVVRRALEPLLSDEDPAARHSCVRAAPPSLLADLALDPHPAVARSAMLSWSLVGESAGGRTPGRRLSLRSDEARERLLVRLARSPHEAVRGMARQEIGLLAWLDPGSPESRAAARRRLSVEPERVVADLRAVLLTGDPEERVAAVRTVRALGLQASLEAELLGLCDSQGDGARARVAATAVAAVAELGTEGAARAVERRVSASEARVRANAVEGVGTLMRRGVQRSTLRTRLVELKDDPQHRARANALRALLLCPHSAGDTGGGLRVYEPAAVDSLLAMLSDGRVEHRLAAAWVAGRVLPFEGAARLGSRWVEVGVRVHGLAEGDPDARVRTRAMQCAGLLRARLRPSGTVVEERSA